jgi:glycosyltransferase involved in cell wall biosynthesis
MSVGLPVMTARRGAMAEVAGDAALLVDPLDQGQLARTLHRLHAEPELRRDLARAGPAQASRWNWSATVAATLPVYGRLTAPQ